MPIPWLASWILIAPSIGAAEPCESEPPAMQLAHAQTHIAAGAWDEALRCVDLSVAPLWAGHHTALKGIAFLQTARAPDAVIALQAALDDPNLRAPLRDVVRLHLGRALHQIEDYTGAKKMLGDLLSGSLQKPGARPKPAGVDPAEVRWALAEVSWSAGDKPSAVQMLRELWTHNPTSTLSVSAREKLESWEAALDVSTQADQALFAKRIRTLERQYLPAEALALREQLPPDHSLLAPRALAGAVFKAKDYSRAVQLLNALSSRTPDEGVLLALAYVRSGDPEASIETYRALSRGSGSVAELAAYKIGYMAFDQQDWAGATRAFGRYQDRYPGGKHSEAALWFTGMAHLRTNSLSDAHKTFKRLEVSYPGSSLRPGAVYWQAMTTSSHSQQTLLNKVIRLWPETSYAWFSQQALGIPYPQKAQAQPEAEVTLNAPSWTLGNQLAEAGLHAWARPHLESLIKASKTLSKSQRIGLANALISAGSYRSAKRLVRAWCGKPAEATKLQLIQACWPQPNASVLYQMTEAAGLPRYLPFAIMTAESALDPSVTSPAGARGLMQLMPTLAEELHRDMWPDQPFSADDMYAPAYNSTLGTTELIRLAEQFSELPLNETLPMVIAGYNGGSEAVSRWVDAYSDQATSSLTDWSQRPIPDVWAEFIGYSETRKYVRRVLGYLQTYMLAYGSQPAQEGASSSSGTKAMGSPGEE